MNASPFPFSIDQTANLENSRKVANHSICDLFYVCRLLVLHIYPEGTQRFMFFLNGKNPGGQTLKETGQQLVFYPNSHCNLSGGGGG
jgi:hypothetical protein